MESDSGKRVIFIMGVSGCGKTTIGQLLAAELAIPFIDGDDYHPQSNIEKMTKGIPLTDTDRRPWLDEVNRVAIAHADSGCVIACSALKESYRTQLQKSIDDSSFWIYLKGTFEQVLLRMKSREGHFMGAEMLESQFGALEEPSNALVIDVADSPEIIIKHIKSHLA